MSTVDYNLSRIFIIRLLIQRIDASGYSVLDLHAMDVFVKLGHTYTVFADANMTYWNQEMVLNSSKSWDTAHLSRMIRRMDVSTEDFLKLLRLCSKTRSFL
ncbi:hypothetical protein Tco_0328862 [Tanacetum coccineum]